jgi:hypothetical protein
MAAGERSAGARLGDVGRDFVRGVQVRPWSMLLLSAAAGYVLGGGFFSRFTRPLARAALGALLVPGFRERFAGTTRTSPRAAAVA